MDYEKIHNLSLELGRKLIEKNPELREWVESKLPELRESEDETTRKELLDFVRSFWADHKEKLPQASRWVIYLEKKKEKSLSTEEQKPNIELIQRSWYLEGYHDREFGKEPMWIIKTGEGGPKYLPNPKYGQPLADKQKPAEWNDTDMKEARYNLITCCRDWERGERTTLLPIVAVRARYFLEHLIEQKPTWSEEDKENIELIAEHLDNLGNTAMADILRNLHPQPKPAWSEEDNLMLTAVIQTLENFGPYGTIGMQIDWLKSLRSQPKQEWSEENERMRNQLIYDVEQRKEKLLISAKQNKATKAIYDGIEKCQDEKIAWLKSLRPSWKPSEEQMGALKNGIRILPPGENNDILVSLYDDLKKLM